MDEKDKVNIKYDIPRLAMVIDKPYELIDEEISYKNYKLLLLKIQKPLDPKDGKFHLIYSSIEKILYEVETEEEFLIVKDIWLSLAKDFNVLNMPYVERKNKRRRKSDRKRIEIF